MVRRCQACQSDNPDDSAFCTNCGASILRSASSAPKPGRSAQDRELTQSDLIAQYVEPGEQILFSSEIAVIKRREGYGDIEKRRQYPESGTLVITDRRIYVAAIVGA